MQLIFLRHAKAEPHSFQLAAAAMGSAVVKPDAERALVEKGRRQIARVVHWCREREVFPDLILTSPLRRALESAHGVAHGLGLPDPHVVPWLAIGRAGHEAISELQAYTGFSTVMVVGHEPDFSLILGQLLGCTAGAIPVSKASLIGIDCRTLVPGRAELQYCVPNRLM